MEQLNFKLTGTAPLLMHSTRFVDPLDEATIQHKQLTGKRKKTEEDQREIAKSEWLAGLYWDDTLGAYIPTDNIHACIHDAAKKQRLGKVVKESVLFETYPGFKIYHTSKAKTPEKMWQDKQMVDARVVVVNRARIIRYRPIFREWSLEGSVLFDANDIDRKSLIYIFEEAGRLKGLCDGRPRFGRFAVDILN